MFFEVFMRPAIEPKCGHGAFQTRSDDAATKTWSSTPPRPWVALDDFVDLPAMPTIIPSRSSVAMAMKSASSQFRLFSNPRHSKQGLRLTELGALLVHLHQLLNERAGHFGGHPRVIVRKRS
jgi:hypothetical protein